MISLSGPPRLANPLEAPWKKRLETIHLYRGAIANSRSLHARKHPPGWPPWRLARPSGHHLMRSDFAPAYFSLARRFIGPALDLRAGLSPSDACVPWHRPQILRWYLELLRSECPSR